MRNEEGCLFPLPDTVSKLYNQEETIERSYYAAVCG